MEWRYEEAFSGQKISPDEGYQEIFFLLYSILLFERAIVVSVLLRDYEEVTGFMAYEVHEHEHTQRSGS